MGRILAVKVRTEAYNVLLAKAKRGLKPKDPKTNTWVLTASDDFTELGSSLEKEANKAKMYLERVITDHPNTPWALLAQRELDAKIGWVAGEPELMKAGKRGKFAQTKFEVIERFAGITLLRCLPETDRKHQIRAHLQFAGLPPVGDAYYGGSLLMLSRLKKNYRPRRDGSEKPLLDRAALHYSKLSFKHPFTGEPVEINCEMAKDMQVAIKYLRKYAPAN